jgi:PPOX class probable F420-dependent enzyme
MTDSQVNDFLAKANIARLATVRPNGSPFNIPVWYEWDPTTKSLLIVGRKRSTWVENLKHEPRVCVLIDVASQPFTKVLIEGTAQIVSSEPEKWVPIAKRMARRYLGPNIGNKYFEESIDQPRFLIKVTAKSITTWINPSDEELEKRPRLDWPSKYYEPRTKWYEEYQNEKSARQDNV